MTYNKINHSIKNVNLINVNKHLKHSIKFIFLPVDPIFTVTKIRLPKPIFAVTKIRLPKPILAVIFGL